MSQVVPGRKLLYILAIARFPQTLPLFMPSFLSGRWVKMRIPGFTSPVSLYTFLGIFQGSSLSSILFASTSPHF
jgi:hypothetical protein